MHQFLSLGDAFATRCTVLASVGTDTAYFRMEFRTPSMKSALMAQASAQSSNLRMWRPSAPVPPIFRKRVTVSTQLVWHSMQLLIQSRGSVLI